MNLRFWLTVGAVAASVFSLTPNIAIAAPAVPGAVRWNELQSVIEGRQISVALADGATVDGKCTRVQADALSIHVTKTSDAAKHPKGATNVARSELAQLTVKGRSGWKGRAIGLIAGGAIAAVIAGTVHSIANNEGGSGVAYGGAAAAGGVSAIGVGYLVGWLFDRSGSRPEQAVRILPDDAIR